MDKHNRFYEPERGGGLVGWAVKLLAMWLAGGFVLYTVFVNYHLFRVGSPAPESRASIAGANTAPAEPPVRERLQPLGQAAPLVTNSLSLRAQPNGYAFVKASVNGAEMVMAFDTGASEVALTKADAIRAGVAGNLVYSKAFSTANGQTRGAPVMLREIRIGELVIADVPADVMENGAVSLLGQTFLNRLQSYKVEDGMLTLTWQQ